MDLKTRSALLRFLLLAVSALTLWIFAHDFVAQSINQRVAKERTTLEKGEQHHTWDVNKASDLVAVFSGRKKSIHWLGDQVGFSLAMPTWPVSPKLHNILLLSFEVSGNQPVDWVIEFSDLKTGRFYMASVPLFSGKHEIQLNQLSWRDDLNNLVVWQDVPRVNTLVIRGFADGNQRWLFDPWQLKQSQIMNPDPWQAAECDRDTEWGEGNWQLSCFSSNAMVKLDQNVSQKSPFVAYKFNTYFEVTAWIWLIVFVVLMCWACAGFVHSQLAVLNGLFLAVVVLLIIPELMGVAVWFALPVVAWQAWRNKSAFITRQSSAWKEWSVVFLLTLLLWSLGSWQFNFISQWPVYLLWAMFQQLLMIAVFSYLKKGAMPVSLVIAVTALLFALFHVPNHYLMAATLIGGLFWMWVWSKYQNLLLMIVSHSLWALLLYQAAGETWLHSARVGINFL